MIVLAGKLAMSGAVALPLLSLGIGVVILLGGDKVLRPRVARDKVALPFVWFLMGCLGGFEVLGPVGLVVGPVALTIARELWEQRAASEHSQRRTPSMQRACASTRRSRQSRAEAAGRNPRRSRTYPDDVDARKRALKDSVITDDGFSQNDSHTVRIFDPKTRTLIRRPVQIGDRATLYGWVDWMLSPSSNLAAGMVMREALLMRQYGKAYPPSEAEIKQFFDKTPKSELTVFDRTFSEPMVRNGQGRRKPRRWWRLALLSTSPLTQTP